MLTKTSVEPGQNYKRKLIKVTLNGVNTKSQTAQTSLLEPNKSVWRLVIIRSVWPIIVVAGAVITIAILTPAICCGTRELHANCHAVVVHCCVSLPVKRCVRIRATMLWQRHHSVLVLVANLRKLKRNCNRIL